MLSILLQKSDPYHPWGFTVTGGRDIGFQIAIDQVTPGTLAARYLAPGDKIIKIDDLDTSRLRQSEAALIIARPTKCMDLLVLKCDDIGDRTETSASRKSRYSDSNRARERVQSEREGSLRERKRIFWDKCSRDDTDYSFGKGFSRLSKLVNGPVKDRMSRKEVWRRCVSEDRSDDSFSPQSSDSREIPARPERRAWSPSPSYDHQFRFRSDSGSSALDSVYNTTESSSSMNQSYTVSYEPTKPGPFSPRSDHYSESSSPFTPDSDRFSSRTSFSFSPSRLKKPSDFWGQHLQPNGSKRTTSSVPRTSNCFWNNLSSNKQSSQFKRSVSLSESYSSSDGPKAFEKTEKRNETELVESLCKDGKEERYEKSEKGEEVVVMENHGDVESRHVVNDFSRVERTVGDAETYNTIRTHSEEKTRSATPPGFYDNTRQNVQVKEAMRASPCSHKVEVESLVSLSSINENKSEKEMNIGVKTKDIFSTDSVDRFESSTPFPPGDEERQPATNQKSNASGNTEEKHKDEQNKLPGDGGTPKSSKTFRWYGVARTVGTPGLHELTTNIIQV